MSTENTGASASSPETASNTTEATENTEETAVEATEEESTEVTPAAEAAKVEEKKANKRKLKLKVDGVESEEEVDLDDDAYLTRQLQLAKMGQKRAQEYSQLEKEVAAFLTELKKNPKKALAHPDIGVDVKALARQIIEEEIANDSKTPEQLKAEALEAEIKELKEAQKSRDEEAKSKEIERLQKDAYEKYDMQMSQALEKSDLPKKPYVVKKIADYMLLGLQNNIDITPDVALNLAREEILEDIQDMFSVMPEEVIEGIVGKKTIDKLRKKRVAAVKAGAPQLPNKTVADTGTHKKEDSAPGKKMTVRDWLKV